MRKEYKMTEEQKQAILKASEPVRLFAPGGVWPKTPQENANDAWEALGRELGFYPYTVQPIPGKEMEFFSAEPTEEKVS